MNNDFNFNSYNQVFENSLDDNLNNTNNIMNQQNNNNNEEPNINNFNIDFLGISSNTNF